MTLVARRPLSDTLSRYLVERIESQPNINVLIGSEVAALDGSGHDLSSVVLRDRGSGSKSTHQVHHVFSFIGDDPNTDWLSGSGIQLDPRGLLQPEASLQVQTFPCKPVDLASSRLATSARTRSS